MSSSGSGSFGKFLLRRLLDIVIAPPVRRKLRSFLKTVEDPAGIQGKLLMRIIRRHQDTGFGRDHGFASIRNLGDFRRALPISGYERLSPYIDRMRRGDYRALLADQKIHMFALTSGTTATRKLIPVNSSYLTSYRRGWNLWGLRAFQDHVKIPMTPIVQMSGDWREELTEGGIPCGAVTGLTATMQNPIIRRVYAVPGSAGRVKDPVAKQYLAMRLSMPRQVGMVLAANPSTLVNLARFGNDHADELIRDIHDGSLSVRHDIPADIRREVSARTGKPNPDRARELELLRKKEGTLYPKDYWPEWTLLGNWTGGSMGAYLRQYPKYFGPMPIRDVGLIASEGRMTIPVADSSPSGVLDIVSHFFEFVPEGEMGSQNPRTLLAHELEAGQSYFILLTTDYGLYRYDIRDLVRCTGFFGKTPMLEFLNKGAYFSNLTGEKLSEYHVTQAVARALALQDLSLASYSVAPIWDERLPCYGLHVEAGELESASRAKMFVESVERLLLELNVEYESKRSSQRLGPMKLVFLRPGYWMEWDRKRLSATRGAPEQYKHPCLINDLGFHTGLGKADLAN
ncbi:MAG: GH3 auxin-responsive promoter family protein [Planctomycetes bacterium]|nr:GH3 auxin-responsive promoter family protein [Planctomycetota bacterium]